MEKAAAESVKKAGIGAIKLASKLAKLRESRETFDFNLLDISHPDFHDVEKRCYHVQGPSASLTRDIENLKQHAELAGRYSLSANQIGIIKRFFVIAKKPHLKSREWINHDIQSTMLDAYINPKILDRSKLMEFAWEQTACFPTMRFRKLRHHSVTVQYLTEEMDQVTREMSGWQARIFQQCEEHLNGILPFDELKNVLDSDLLEEFQDDSLPMEEFKEAKEYRLFGKDVTVPFSQMGQQKVQQQQQKNSGKSEGLMFENQKIPFKQTNARTLNDIGDTIHEMPLNSKKPIITGNKTSKKSRNQ